VVLEAAILYLEQEIAGTASTEFAEVASSVHSKVFVTVAVTLRFIILYGIDDMFFLFFYIYLYLWKIRDSSCSLRH
jgi:hypothetical protein